MQRTTQLQIKAQPKGPTLFAWSLFVKCSYQTTMWHAKMQTLSQGYLHDGMSTFSKRNKGKIDHSRVPYALTLKIGLFTHLIHRRVSRIVDISLSTKYDNRNRNYHSLLIRWWFGDSIIDWNMAKWEKRVWSSLASEQTKLADKFFRRILRTNNLACAPVHFHKENWRSNFL